MRDALEAGPLQEIAGEDGLVRRGIRLATQDVALDGALVQHRDIAEVDRNQADPRVMFVETLRVNGGAGVLIEVGPACTTNLAGRPASAGGAVLVARGEATHCRGDSGSGYNGVAALRPSMTIHRHAGHGYVAALVRPL